MNNLIRRIDLNKNVVDTILGDTKYNVLDGYDLATEFAAITCLHYNGESEVTVVTDDSNIREIKAIPQLGHGICR